MTTFYLSCQSRSLQERPEVQGKRARAACALARARRSALSKLLASSRR